MSLSTFEKYKKTTKEDLMKRKQARQEAIAEMWTPELESRVREELLEVCPSLERLPLLMQSLLHVAKWNTDPDGEAAPYMYLRDYLDLADLELKLQKMGR